MQERAIFILRKEDLVAKAQDFGQKTSRSHLKLAQELDSVYKTY